MKGIQSPYVYVGTQGSGFQLHLEDGNMGALNYNHRGKPKVWYATFMELLWSTFSMFSCRYFRILIPPEENAKLERLSKKLSKSKACDFYIRHKTMLIPPSLLEKHKIKFARVIQASIFNFIFLLYTTLYKYIQYHSRLYNMKENSSYQCLSHTTWGSTVV